MADGDISLLAIYDKIASVDTKVEALSADVRAQLAHGQRRMEDHEARLRALEAAAPENAKTRLGALEDDRQRKRGMSLLAQGLLTLAGSSASSALITYLLTRH